LVASLWAIFIKQIGFLIQVHRLCVCRVDMAIIFHDSLYFILAADEKKIDSPSDGE
jgi:hypothetical protein